MTNDVVSQDNRFLDKKAQTRGPLEMIEADVFERVKGMRVDATVVD